YGDAYVPYIKQDEPLKLECQHFLDCVRSGSEPLTSGRLGLEVVRILEAAGQSLGQQGAAVDLELETSRPKINFGVAAGNGISNGNGHGDGNGHAHSNGHGNGNGHSHGNANGNGHGNGNGNGKGNGHGATLTSPPSGPFVSA